MWTSFSWNLRESGARKQRPEKRRICRMGSPILPGLQAGMSSHFVGLSLRPLSSSPLWQPAQKACVASWGPPTVPSSKKAVVSKGLLMDSACVRPPEMAPSRPRAKRSGPEGSPCTPLLLGIFSGPNTTKLSLEQHKSQNLAGLALFVGFPEENRTDQSG